MCYQGGSFAGNSPYSILPILLPIYFCAESDSGNNTDSPVLIPFSQGRIDLFARGVDSQLQHKYFDGKWQPAQYEKYVPPLSLLR